MNNDLISRNAVMDYLREQQASVIIEKNKNGFVSADVFEGMDSAISAFMNFILQVPVAYDVDKVIELLEDRSTLSRPVGWSKAYEIVTLDDAVEIVKSGGIE